MSIEDREELKDNHDNDLSEQMNMHAQLLLMEQEATLHKIKTDEVENRRKQANAEEAIAKVLTGLGKTNQHFHAQAESLVQQGIENFVKRSAVARQKIAKIVN